MVQLNMDDPKIQKIIRQSRPPAIEDLVCVIKQLEIKISDAQELWALFDKIRKLNAEYRSYEAD